MGSLGLLMVVACGGGSSDAPHPCECDDSPALRVCGKDGVTYNLSCGMECPPVDIRCFGSCPCDPVDPVTTSSSETNAGSAGSADESGGDPCDCDAGAYVPACGADGVTYDAACGTECIPVEILCMVECPCPELDCGPRLVCGPSTPVCTELIGGPAGSEPSYSCDPIPVGCETNPECACVNPACECVEDPEDYFYVTCAAP